MTREGPRAFGADRVEADGDELLLECPVSKGWNGRTARTPVRAAHPGATVAWEDRLFEVLAEEPLPNGGVRYRLAPWEDGQAIRRFERYDADAERARESFRQDLASGIRKRRWSVVLAPLAGLLPGSVQKRMEHEFGAPSLGMTIASALPLFVVGFLGMFRHLLGVAGGALDWPWWVAPPLPLALYLFGESALRLASAIAAGEPMGSLPVVVAYAAWKEARGESASAKLESRAAPEADRAQAIRDRYRMLEPLLSLLPSSAQRELTGRFGFDAIRWGRITAWVLLVVGSLNALAALGMLASGRGHFLDFLGFFAGSLLAAEQIPRLGRLARGEPAGSVLGALVRPLAAPLFGETPRGREPSLRGRSGD
jgi:hypothetical protein